MAETNFTPGPWSLPHFAIPDINCQCGYVLTDGMMGAVATVYASGEGGDWQKHGDNPKFAEAVANAHLIAAAPDLYAALADLVDLIDKVAPEYSESPMASNARIALSKARSQPIPEGGEK